MKLRIMSTFEDKYTHEVYKKNDVKDFADERAKELLADERGLVKEEPASKGKKARSKESD